jgi:hypothetical protein
MLISARVAVVSLALVGVGCDKDEPAAKDEPTETPTRTLPSNPPPMPSRWIRVDRQKDAGGIDAADSHARLVETKEKLKAKVAAGQSTERDRAILRVLCNSLGDESCSKKQSSHSQAVPSAAPTK